MRVLAFMKYGELAASTRQRLLQYRPDLDAAGIEVEYLPLLNNDHIRRLADGRPASAGSALMAYLRRGLQLLFRRDYDLIWVHCELFPYLAGFFERLAFLSGKPVVYDYDDAIFHMYDANRRPFVRRMLGRKLEPLLRGAAACCCGNAYLKAYADRFCDNAIILPTVVDTASYWPALPREGKAPLVIGWIGSPSTWAYVRPLLPLLRELADHHKVRIRAVGAGTQAEADAFPGLDLIEWSEESEIREVQAMDIGIMPLPDEPWARGKCGYKLIQYMACGLPVIASPVGVNSEIIQPDIHGYLADSPAQWRDALIALIEDRSMRQRMGLAGREKVEEHYSLKSQAPRLVTLLKSLPKAISTESALTPKL